jgi:hypothetical protein
VRILKRCHLTSCVAHDAVGACEIITSSNKSLQSHEQDGTLKVDPPQKTIRPRW